MNANNDRHKVEELFRGILVGPWGTRADKSTNAEEKTADKEQSPTKASQIKLKIKPPTNLSMIPSMTKIFFEKTFQKVILHNGAKNCLKLLQISSSDNKNGMDVFLNNYTIEKDAMIATFQALKFKREYLYQTFDKNNVLNKLQVDKKDAIEKMSEFALKNPNYNRTFVKAEQDFKIQEEHVLQKAKQRERRRLAKI